jgi:hypothetical protein
MSYGVNIQPQFNAVKDFCMRKAKKVRSVRPITPAQFIRQHLLLMQAVELAEKLDVTAGIVSRYEVFPEKHRRVIEKMVTDRYPELTRAMVRQWFERVPFQPTVPNV